MAVETIAKGPSPTRRAPSPRRRRRYRRSDIAWGAAFVAPAVVLFAVMGAYTIGYGFSLSFATWNGFAPTWRWVGLQNYADLLWADPRYSPRVQGAARNTLWVMVAVPLLTVAVSFPLAVLLNSVRRLKGLLRSVYFLPQVTSGIAVYFAWMYVLQPDGAINLLLRSVGLGSLQQPQGFLGNPSTALPTLIVITVWSSVPIAMMLYLAGLQTIDPNLVEAARVDGAGSWHATRHIVWPLLRPITAIVVLLAVRDSLQGFQTFLVMTNGGPGNHTNVLGLETYKLAFLSQLDPTLGLSSALGWLLFLAALILAVVNLRAMRRLT
ncbi:sugar ABC transporter permease [Dactylosporangium sp. NPDC005572]|uniref:carbohydrate ABC transporter permease n=1 Tax=Dactylosporangium sp. NPDC005572 TaxID=3156889 RepID=UPI0033AF5AD0